MSMQIADRLVTRFRWKRLQFWLLFATAYPLCVLVVAIRRAIHGAGPVGMERKSIFMEARESMSIAISYGLFA